MQRGYSILYCNADWFAGEPLEIGRTGRAVQLSSTFFRNKVPQPSVTGCSTFRDRRVLIFKGSMSRRDHDAASKLRASIPISRAPCPGKTETSKFRYQSEVEPSCSQPC